MKLRWKFIIIAIILLLGFIYSVSTGQSSLSLQELWQSVLGNGTPRQELVLFQFRIPRMILGFLVGGALAIAGMLLQAISRNALADPGILGINAGAGLSMMLFLLLQNSSMAYILMFSHCMLYWADLSLSLYYLCFLMIAIKALFPFD